MSSNSDKDTDCQALLAKANRLEQFFIEELNDFKKQLAQLKQDGGEEDGLERLVEKLSLFEENVKSEVKSLSQQVSRVHLTVDQQFDESAQRTNNSKLLIFGIPEDPQEDLPSVVINLIRDKFGIHIDKYYLSDCFRFGKKKDSKRPLPVFVQFVHVWLRNDLITARRVLKNSKYFIVEFLTSQRYRLYREVGRTFKKRCWTSYGKIVFLKDGEKFKVTTIEEYKKIVS